MSDARIATSLPSHPKTKKLIRRAGYEGAWRWVCLILWARQNRPDGNLEGMSAEDIELAVDWQGEPDALVRALVDVGFLDAIENGYRIHDWEEHNPWSTGASDRSERSRWKALVRHHGRQYAAQKMPEYVKKHPELLKEGNADSPNPAPHSTSAGSTEIPATGMQGDASSTETADSALRGGDAKNDEGTHDFASSKKSCASGTKNGASGTKTPCSVSVSVPVSDSDSYVKKNPIAQLAVAPPGFDRFWQAWPKSQRKVDKAKCLKAWVRGKLEPSAEAIVAHVTAMAASEQWRSGFEPAPLTYLNGKRWFDPLPDQMYSPQQHAVIESYNAVLAANGWPEAIANPYSPPRASAIDEFIGIGKRQGWYGGYFEWLAKHLEAKPGFGFDWAIKRESVIRAKEGNFAALKEATA